jgi:adenylyl-sulfate kinase
MNEPHRPNIFNQVKPLPRAERERLLGAHGGVLWFTGLSGSGKSTVARALENALITRGRMAYVLDGDEIRNGLNRDLGFTQGDREENIRRIAEVARLFSECGVICITSFISPLRRHREQAKTIIGADRFAEVFIDADLAICEARDPKGLYKKARAGEITQFTGIDSAYEPPEQPALRFDTAVTSPDEATAGLIDYLTKNGMLPIR